MRAPSTGEKKFELYWRAIKGQPYVAELVFHQGRRWRFDFAWPDSKVALEVEGGVFVGGGHVRGRAYTNNCEKYNEAIFDGWTVFRLTPDQITAATLERIRDYLFTISH